jgi:predicted enzyme related to lactoylglutathione lyase
MGARVVHFEIHAGDLDRAQQFYEGVFGWQITRFEGVPIDYRLATTGEAGTPGIDGAMLQAEQRPGAYVCTIAVDDIDATEEAIRTAGGTLALERGHIPGVGQFSYWQDTEGNVFGVLQQDG